MKSVKKMTNFYIAYHTRGSRLHHIVKSREKQSRRRDPRQSEHSTINETESYLLN